MEKQSLIVILKEHLQKEEENCAILHLVDGADLLVLELPKFFNLHLEYTVNLPYEENLFETFHIPFQNVVYVVTTNKHNLEKVVENYNYNYRKKMDEAFKGLEEM